MFSVAGVLIVVAATITTTSQKSQGYFCPYGELLIEDKCYKYHKTSLTQPEAEELCQEDDRTLPSKVQEHLTGWIKDTPAAWAGLPDRYCVAGFPDPAGQVNPEQLVYQLGPCSHQLPVVCAKEITNSSCAVGWVKVAITLDGTETSYCVQPSTETTSGGENMKSNICPDDMRVLGFDFGTTNSDIEIDTSTSDDWAVAILSKLTFWTPYFLKKGTKVITDKDGAVHGDLNSCLYKLYSSALRVGSCQRALPFYCETSARTIPDPEESEDGEAYDPAKEYFCEDDEDLLCKERCLKHRKVYSTLEEATSNCTGDGYKLVSASTAQNVSSCAGYSTGWVSGVNSSVKLDNICVSVFGGGMLVGDCRKQLPVLCLEHSYDYGNCPSGFEKCDDNSSCVGTSDASYSWDAGVTMRSACTTSTSSTSSILSSSKAMESCSGAVKRLSATTAHWIGAGLAQNNVVEYINGDAIDGSDLDIEKECLSVFGGKLVRSNCETLKEFACEKRASITKPPGNSNTAVIVVLVIAPIGLVAAILVLVYKRRNIEVCFGGAGPTADEEEQHNYDNVVMNPVVVIDGKQTENLYDQELIVMSPAKKQGAENNEENDEDHIYTDVELKPIDI